MCGSWQQVQPGIHRPDSVPTASPAPQTPPPRLLHQQPPPPQQPPVSPECSSHPIDPVPPLRAMVNLLSISIFFILKRWCLKPLSIFLPVTNNTEWSGEPLMANDRGLTNFLCQAICHPLILAQCHWQKCHWRRLESVFRAFARRRFATGHLICVYVQTSLKNIKKKFNGVKRKTPNKLKKNKKGYNTKPRNFFKPWLN